MTPAPLDAVGSAVVGAGGSCARLTDLPVPTTRMVVPDPELLTTAELTRLGRLAMLDAGAAGRARGRRDGA